MKFKGGFLKKILGDAIKDVEGNLRMF